MEKYLINQVEVEESDFYDELEQDIRSDLEDGRFDDMLDEMYGTFEICGCKYYASQILYDVDEINYDCSFDGAVDGELNEARYELESYGVYKINNKEYRIQDEDDEVEE